MRKKLASICAGFFDPSSFSDVDASLLMHQGMGTWLMSAEPSGPHLSLFAGRKQPLPALAVALLRLIQWRLHRPRRSA